MLRVAHVLAALRPSGAERMLQCSFGLWREYDVEPVIVGISEGAQPFAPVLREVGYETVVVVADKHTLRGLTALRSALADLRPGIVHVHPEAMFPLVCALARSVPGVNGVVRSIHGYFTYTGMLAVRRVLFSRAAAALNVISVAPTAEVADNEERRYRLRPLVVENWVDVSAYDPGLPERARMARVRLGLTQNDFVLVVLGNCEPAKGHSLLLDALVRMRRPAVVLHIGDEERADELERTRWRLVPSGQRLIRLGRRDDVPTLLAAADILVMPSEREAFGVAAAESFCAATPVLAASAPGLRWVTGFRNGRAVEPNALAWAAELDGLVERRRTGEWKTACLKDAEDAQRRFAPERGVAEWRRIYDRAMAPRSAERVSL